jgi:hypothetical protein
MSKSVQSAPGPLTRDEADRDYRSVRRALLPSIGCMWIVAGVLFAAHVPALILCPMAVFQNVALLVLLRAVKRSIDARVSNTTGSRSGFRGLRPPQRL